MVEPYIIFNAIVYACIVAYILYINFASYYNSGTGFLNWLIRLNQSWVFRTIYLLIVGFFALDLFPWGGFTLAILLTIAFLNTNMLMYKKDLNEKFTNMDNFARVDYDSSLPTMTPSGDMMTPSADMMTPSAEMTPSADMMTPSGMENFDNNGENCRTPFNPQPYRPDESLLVPGFPDKLPQDSELSAPYTQSGIGYEFNMA